MNGLKRPPRYFDMSDENPEDVHIKIGTLIRSDGDEGPKIYRVTRIDGRRLFVDYLPELVQ